MRGFLGLFLATCLIPGIALALSVLPYVNEIGVSDPFAIAGAATACLLDGAQEPACEALLPYNALGAGALAVFGANVALLLGVVLISLLTGWHRSLLALSFPIVAFFSMLAVALITLGQAALAAGSIFVAESYFFDAYHPQIVIAVALVGALVALAVLGSIFHMFRPATTGVIGIPVKPVDAPHIHRTVQVTAQKLGTRPPDNIVLGLDASFFATSARVHTPFSKHPLKGETLYLSLPLMRMLSDGETRSIIGHELAHFSGRDTAYSKRFAPAYRGLMQARTSLSSQEGWSAAMAWPAAITIDYILGAFAFWEARNSRVRELRADKLGAEIGSAEDLSRSLVKLSFLSQLWDLEFQTMIERVEQGRFCRNLSKNFVDRARFDVDHDKVTGLVALALDSQVAHPTDSHPLTRARIEALGVDAAQLVDPEAFKANMFPAKTIIAKADSIDDIEEALTSAYQDMVVQNRPAASDEAKDRAAFANLISMLLARMVTVDGSVDDREIETALSQAAPFGDLFDPVRFRELCRHPDDIPPTEKLLYWGNSMITTEGAAKLKTILRAIAEADETITEEERDFLNDIDEGLTGEDPPEKA